MKKIFAVGLVGLSLTGCATILSGTSQLVHVKAVDQNKKTLEGVRCSMTDGSGAGYVLGGNPGTVRVSKANGRLTVSCTKKGYRQLNTAVGDNFNAVTLVNVLFWPGFIVDAVSGSYRKFPSHYLVTMEKIQK